ncbi:MAG TPA: type IX secretion system membrane protein PorP/SprF [Cyclobacteriaceae bacterium]|nr:type IX secretion system membrane protein PorP/SprF [Cyclobacteriaceae bacterium]
MKKYSFLLIFVLGIKAYAQQDPVYSQYIFNPFLLNPAYSGFSKDLNAMGAYRVQWAGFDGSPVTMSASANMSFVENKMGVGFFAMNDRIGTSNTTEFFATYAYHLELTNGSRISFGLQAGGMNFTNDYNELNAAPGDPLLQSRISEFAPNFGTGVIYSSDRIYASLSVPRLLKSSTKSGGEEVSFYNQHFYLQAAYMIFLSSRVRIKPFILGSFVSGSSPNIDIGSLMIIDNSYGIGLLSRKFHTYGALVNFNIGDNLRIGYVYEMPTNKSVGINFASHEVTLGLRWQILKFHDISTYTSF